MITPKDDDRLRWHDFSKGERDFLFSQGAFNGVGPSWLLKPIRKILSEDRAARYAALSHDIAYIQGGNSLDRQQDDLRFYRDSIFALEQLYNGSSFFGVGRRILYLTYYILLRLGGWTSFEKRDRPLTKKELLTHYGYNN